MNDDELMPEDPTSSLVESGVHLHILFESLLEAGFTENQACVICGTVIALSGEDG